MSAPHVDWRTLPLTGRSLVEASAGTGKTWTITVLYLRLLLEPGADGEPLGARQVVVTTFSDAAAQELRERLRARLDWAEAEAAAWREGGHAHPRPAGEAPELAWLRDLLASEARASDGRPDGTALHRLRLARAELDLAPIGTIHALCRRVLADHPLEAGVPPVALSVVDARALREELVDDLWRRWTQGGAMPPVGAAYWIGKGRDALAKALDSIALPGLELRGPPPPERIVALMDAAKGGPLRALAARGDFYKRSDTRLIKELNALADFVESGDPCAEIEDLVRLRDDAPENQFKKGRHAEAHALPLLGWAIQAAKALEDKDRDLRHHALRLAHEALGERRDAVLAARESTTFDGMIACVSQAVSDREGALHALLAAQWRAALVDECQDTDPRQFAIFDALFPAGAADGRPLVLIGDPKQAIYRFRGGDLHTYLRAARGAQLRLVLADNRRSSSRYVAALNAWHAAAGDALLHDEIRYEPVRAAGDADRKPFRVDGRAVVAPLVLHDWDPERPLPVAQAARERLALVACADLVVDLVASGRHTLDGAPLTPGAIAVLLPDNRQVDLLRRLLRERRVPCVGLTRDSVWQGEWAWALQVVLHAVANPGDGGALRAALATRLFGRDWNALRALDADAAALRAEGERFHALAATWRGAGVLAVVRRLVEEAAPRLLGAADGERALTDLRHLGELLAAEATQRHGMAALLAWFAARRRESAAEDDEAADAQRLRLESDARRVRLLTLHGSKGLEFDLVLLPVMWTGGRERVGEVPRVHDAASGASVADLGGPLHEVARDEAAHEDQRERARLLYVALTRARHACHVFALPRDRAQGRTKKPPEDPQRSVLDRHLATIEAGASTPIDGVEWRCGWPQRVGDGVLARPAPSALPEPAAMPAEREPRALYSFTALVRGGARGAEGEAAAADEARTDALDAPTAGEPHPALAELAMVGGADFGNALHDVLERRDLARPLSAQRSLVEQCLREWVVRSSLPTEALAARVAARLDGMLAADLGGGLRIVELAARDQRAELGFDFVLDGSSVARLRAACTRHGQPALLPAALGQRTLRGLMTGRIDLVLRHGGRHHVLDWKSNRLGDGLADYAGAALAAAMDAHHYPLQALLYQVALHRHLRAHLPGYQPARDLGDPIYLFVRAVGLAPAAGVWRGAFDGALLDAVDAALGGAGEDA